MTDRLRASIILPRRPPDVYDDDARRAIATLEGHIDTQAATAVWEAALAATWHGSPVWFMATSPGAISWSRMAA